MYFKTDCHEGFVAFHGGGACLKLHHLPGNEEGLLQGVGCGQDSQQAVNQEGVQEDGFEIPP